MFAKNNWYVAATVDELEEKPPLGRTICNEKIVFYQTESGKVHAVEDFCPHRGAPLSLGFIQGEHLVCGYHGLVMGCEGKTVSMTQQKVDRFPRIKAYPVEVRYGYVWVWPGDAGKADKANIPKPLWADNPGWTVGGGMFHIHCDYRLMIDNLMDLTHETYVHRGSIGQPEIEEAPVNSRAQGDTVITERLMENIKAPPFWQAAMQAHNLDPEASVDRWQVCRFNLPSQVMIDVGVALAGKGGLESAPEHQVGGVVVDFLTPETETSMWYFWGMARNFMVNNSILTDQIRTNQMKIFSEDLAMLEQQQDNITRHPERHLLKLNIDKGGMLARAKIEQMLKAEQATA
ncbi:MAG TPA: aromatic ring-hydroxylating dioxygenase subunit alpha [Thiolinea sp.]|nr:aromatic ring-hydroxylating dioxygenase subunit alpha [Thiolinea sp.]